MTLKFSFYILLFFTTCFSTLSQIYVSTSGKDTNNGSKNHPLATLGKAMELVRQQPKIKNLNTIIIEDGYYEITSPLVFTHTDGGLRDNPLILKAAKGAHPIISGGKKIKGFKINNDGLWEMEIQQCKNGKFRFDQLYVNGKRAKLATMPDDDFWYIKDIKETILVKGSGRTPERSTLEITLTPENIKTLAALNKNELKLLRFRAYHKWDLTIRHIDSIDVKRNIIYTTGKGMLPWNPLKPGGRIIFENFKAALNKPGEWFLNNDGTLFYHPYKDENINTANVVIPVLNKLISVDGNASEEEFVRNITFEGLSFRHCNFRIPKAGFEPNQAAISVNAAIQLNGAININFINCSIEKTGQHALWYKNGCSHCSIKNCYINDIGGGGIYIGTTKPLEGLPHTFHINIENNIIHSGGRELPSSVGIWIGHSSNNLITHNDIADFYYTGVSVGWTWGYTPGLAKRNIITYNNIHHIGWALLSDLAAVYTLGKSKGTKINNNVIHHIHSYSYGGWGLYTDEGSSFIEMKNNLVYNTKTGSFHQHYGKNNIISNNIFAYAKMYQIQCTKAEDHMSFTLNNNIIIFDEGVVLKGPWNKINTEMDNNIYWNTKVNKYNFDGLTFDEWKKTGHDQHSLIANPEFVNPDKRDFRFKSSSVIKKTGFIPFNYTKAGVYGSRKWKEKALLPIKIITDFDNTIEQNMKQ
ncbi:MAG: right-handed parallel beta-helix repeat-containing protein [Chlorobi bacterium]|nr:right-handed parallel beta-helix repeat-containing protein [Chlorobiota bacterium]